MSLKNLYLYYALILAPLVILLTFSQFGLVTPTIFVLCIMIYGVLYHPLISGLRLVALRIISLSQLPYAFIPGWTILYFRELYLPKN